MFPAASKSFERRTARAGGEQRRPLPPGRFSRHHETAIRIDIDVLALTSPANGTNGLLVGLPESAFRTASGEQVRFNELPPEDEAIDDSRLETGPDASAALTPRLAPRTGQCTKFALFASVALHVLAAAAFLTWMQEDGARIAGGAPSEIAGIGNASMDQIASGEAVNVTITTIPVVKAQPVEPRQATTEQAQAVEDIAMAEPVRETRAETAPVVETRHIEPTEPVATTRASQAPEPSQVVQPQPTTTPVEADTGASVSDALEILAAPTLSDSADAAPAVQVLSEALPDREPAMANPQIEAARTEDTPPAEALPAEDEPQLAEHAPLPTPRPERVERPVEKAEKRTTEPERKKPVHTAARVSASGSGGRDSADARRGVTEGRTDGQATSSNNNARMASTAGNAAASNYPGKVVAKLRRALRYPSEARSRRLNGVAQVRFVVGSSGDVGSVGLAASSGSPILDKAALATVNRAAPFPPIPEGAGRRSWTFTVPLAFVR
ncbi:energy transducer TonB [Mesorhizobium koreense]|uniref:energy transducer TonB n=1 Tax=Mesorhizobium koreense TaxID=3074855 RepID=UPI00287B67FC|nr:TonB family protein [Mesorhizobium sp. WR6]